MYGSILRRGFTASIYNFSSRCATFALLAFEGYDRISQVSTTRIGDLALLIGGKEGICDSFLIYLSGFVAIGKVSLFTRNLTY
jgi:hypothetical protein